jgi:hypothetical protein
VLPSLLLSKQESCDIVLMVIPLCFTTWVAEWGVWVEEELLMPPREAWR